MNVQTTNPREVVRKDLLYAVPNHVRLSTREKYRIARFRLVHGIHAAVKRPKSARRLE